MKFPIPDKSEPLVDAFNFEEENTIHYVGGYVIAVLKKYQSDKEIIVRLNQLTNNNKQSNICWLCAGGEQRWADNDHRPSTRCIHVY